MPPKKKRLSNKPEKKQAKVLKLPKLVDLIDTSRSGHQNAMPLSKTIDVEKVIKKDKEVKESDVFDLPKKANRRLGKTEKTK